MAEWRRRRRWRGGRMSEPRDELQAIERAAAELVPDLAERLTRHGLGEIEIRRGDLRVRVAANGVAPPAAMTAASAVASRSASGAARATPALPRPSPSHSSEAAGQGAHSPP